VPILGPNGKPISSRDGQFKKAPPPKLGAESFGAWAGRDIQHLQLPGGGIVQFDLNKLTLSDFRTMRDHYQINSSLSVLSFMQHQSDWSIQCDDKKIADECERQLTEVWTPLNRSLATANWAGYSPNALDWENVGKRVVLTKVKDLFPEECGVNWKLVEGWAPQGRIKPKHKVYDGIRQVGAHWPIPVENSFWYPLLMENGDYSGRKLLRPAFQSWFFSLLLHLFANRYYERFGEPTPVGRAPWGEGIDPSGTETQDEIPSQQYLLEVLATLRSRGAVVLPSDTHETGNGSQEYDYSIEYLESQMRGADFERYMTRLDEEMSIGLFTPILLLRTADVGSYNLGVGHMQVYLWMMNALNSDRALYINKYILNKMVNYNFSPSAPRARIVFRKLGNTNLDVVKTLIEALVASGEARPDIRELGRIAGLTLQEVDILTGSSGGEDVIDTNAGGDTEGSVSSGEPRATGDKVTARIAPQVENAFKNGTFGPNLKLNIGYQRAMEAAFIEAHHPNPKAASQEVFSRLDAWLGDVMEPGAFESASEFVRCFHHVLLSIIDGASRA
jgi:hypothetical protein